MGEMLSGEILSIASYIGTPVGGVLAVSFIAALYFYGRWVLSDPKAPHA